MGRPQGFPQTSHFAMKLLSDVLFRYHTFSDEITHWMPMRKDPISPAASQPPPRATKRKCYTRAREAEPATPHSFPKSSK